MGGVQCCGQQPIINQDVWHPSIDDGEFEKAQSQDQQQKQNEVQNDEKKEVNDQEKTATEVEEHFDDDLKSIIEKKSIEFQAPDTTYAIPLQKSEEEFYLPTQRMQQYIKQHWKEINLTLIDKIQYLPYQDIPYKVLIDNSIFIGTWYKGYPEGYGKFTYIINHEQEVGKQQDIKTRDNKTKITRIYEGMVRNGQPHGMGRSLNRQLTCYAGQWRNGMMEGDGELSKIDGFIYKGNFKMNKPHGQGLEKWPNGIVYNGQYSQGKKCGKGRLIWPMPKRDQKELKDIKVAKPQTEENDELNKMPGTQGEQENQNLGEQQNKNEEQQEVYDGEFLDNLYHGKGIYNWKDGRTYNGEWVKGKMEGKGKFTWKQDSYYDGEYKNDLKDGYGEFHFNATCCWKGQWKKGKQDGKGKLCVNDVEYEGIWKEGKRVQWIIGPSSSSKFGNFSAINPIRNETSTIKQSDIGFGQSKNIDLNINPFDQSKLSQQIPVTTQNNQVDFSKVFNSNNTQPKEINLNDLYTSKFTGQPESVLFDKQYANQTADFNNGLINDSNNFGINKNNFNINYLDTNNNNFGSSTQNNNFNIQAQQPLIESKEQLQPNTFKSPKEFEELQVKDEHSKQNYDMGNQQQDQHENPQIDQKLTFQKDNVFHDQPIIQNQSQAEKQPQNKNYQSLFQQENAQPKIEQQLQQIHQNIFIHQPQIQTQQSQTEATHQQPILQPQVQVPSQSYMQPEIKPTQQAEPLQQQQFQPQQNMLSQNLPQNQVENQYQQQNQPNQQVTTNQQLQSQDQQQQQIQDLQLQQQFQQQQPHQEKTFEQQQQTIQPKPNFSLQQYQDQVQTQNNDHQNAQDKQQNSDLPKIKLSQGMMGDTQNNHPNQLSPDQLLVQQQEQELQLHQQQPQDLQQQQQQNQSQDQAYIFYSQNQSKEAVQIQQNVQLQQQQIGLLNFDTQKSDKNKNQKEIDEQSKNISNQIDQDSRILKFDQQQQQKPQEVLLENLVSDFTAKDNNQQPKMKNAVEN